MQGCSVRVCTTRTLNGKKEAFLGDSVFPHKIKTPLVAFYLEKKRASLLCSCIRLSSLLDQCFYLNAVFSLVCRSLIGFPS